VVLIEGHCTFTGLDTGDVDLTAPITGTAQIGVWRIDTDNRYVLMAIGDDPIVTAAAEQAPLN
jgi:hypothetical protein